MIPFEALDGGNVHMEDREGKAGFHELSTNMPYHIYLPYAHYHHQVLQKGLSLLSLFESNGGWFPANSNR
jgi:hypothetical protein